MPLRGNLHERAPTPVVRYARGLATSIVHNVPAYGFGVVASAVGVLAAAELRHVTALDVFCFLIGAACAFALVGALGALAFEEEQVERASPQVVFISSIFSLVSTSAGFAAALLVVRNLTGWPAWLLCSFCSTTAYILVLALELEAASLIRHDLGGVS